MRKHQERRGDYDYTIFFLRYLVICRGLAARNGATPADKTYCHIRRKISEVHLGVSLRETLIFAYFSRRPAQASRKVYSSAVSSVDATNKKRGFISLTYKNFSRKNRVNSRVSSRLVCILSADNFF